MNSSRRRAAPLPSEQRDIQQQRLRTRERLRVIGLLLIALIILLIAFFRFGKTIPWGAR